MKHAHLFNRLCLLLPSLAAVSCGDPLKEAQQIEEPRVLAVKIEGPQGTATPAPGQDVTLRFLVAGPEGPLDARVAYRVCEGADASRGVPYCDGAILAEGTIGPQSSVLEVDFTLPEETAEGARLAVLAAACVDGDPSLTDDPLDWSCTLSAKPLNASFDAFVQGDLVNENPRLDSLVIEVEGADVVVEDADVEPACGPEVAGVTGDAPRLSVDLGEGAREAGEWLQVSHFATSGSYERQFTILEPDESTTFEVQWSRGLEGPSKHYLVVRDGRGGVSFSTFSLCAE